MPYKNKSDLIANRIKTRERRRVVRKAWESANPEKVKAQKRRYYLKHKERILEKEKSKYEADPKAWYKRVRNWKSKNKEKERSYQDKWTENNAEKIAKRMKVYTAAKYAENPNKFRARSIIFYHQNKEILRLKRKSVSVHRATMLRKYANQRIDIIRLGSNPEESGQILELITGLKAGPDTRCFYCGVLLAGKTIHIDHIVPLSRGGSHTVLNLCASCPACNLSKNNKTVEEWNQWKQSLGYDSLVGKEE